MPITHGPIISKKLNSKKSGKKQIEANNTNARPITKRKNCLLCHLTIEDNDRITCVQPGCFLVAHILCLGKSFWKDDGMILPIDGVCPSCNTNVLWGDLIRKMIGCNLHLSGEPIDPVKSEDLVILSDDDDSDFEK